MERMENKVQEREAKAAALSEMGTDTLEKKFKGIETKTDVDDELIGIKRSIRHGRL